VETIETARRAENQELALLLERIAGLLEAQGASPFRASAYRRAAATARACPNALVDVFTQEGVHGLERLPAIGRSIASLIREYARSGRISLLERLAGAVSAEEVLATVPGLGPTLAHRVHDALGIETLEELECACHDGTLAGVPGFGTRRIAAIAASTAMALRGGAARPSESTSIASVSETEPSRPLVATLLAVDEEYRQGARDGSLARIAPRRFNPEGEAWLPILHTERDGWSLTALFSNSARAHQLGRTHDWVVIYADRDGRHDQCTVVTERRGYELPRVIRGREFECSALAERARTQPGASSAPPAEAGGHPG
jgi:DNA polymerase (family 10)